MFHVTRRLSASLPIAYFAIGLTQQAWLLPLPSIAMLGFLVWRHNRILAQVGSAPLASDGFARHVMVDDLLRLGGRTLAAPVIYMAGATVGGAL